MSSILIVESDEVWSEGVVTELRGAGHLVSYASNWSRGISALLRERCAILVVSSGLPDISFQELCRFLRSRSGRLPLILFRLPATPGSFPVLRDRIRTLAAVDGTLDPRLGPREAAEVLHSLAVGLPGEGTEALGELVLEASADEGRLFSEVLRAAGLRVASARDLAGLGRLLDSLQHRGLVFLDQVLLAGRTSAVLESLRATAPAARVVIVGPGDRPHPGVASLPSDVQWIPVDCPPFGVLLADLRAQHSATAAVSHPPRPPTPTTR